MLDLMTLFGTVGLDCELTETRASPAYQARGNIFNQALPVPSKETVTATPACSSLNTVDQYVLGVLSLLPDTLTIESKAPRKTA